MNGRVVANKYKSAEDKAEPRGKARVTMKMPADAAQSESDSDDEDRGTSFQDNRRT